MIHKYRAWDTKHKKMWSAEEMGRDQLTLSPDGRGFVNVSGISTRLSQYMPHLIPLQYIGQHDKERSRFFPLGKEIYEGDIVKQKTGKIGVISFDTPNGRWSWNMICDGKPLNSIGHGIYNAEAENYFEVIGNCYDNPELLEK